MIFKSICRVAYRYSNPKINKIQQVGFQKEQVYNLKKLSYTTNRTLNFINGKYLMYEHQRSYLSMFFRAIPYFVGFIGLTYGIFYNPFTSFPAAVPIFFIIELLMLWAFIRRIKRNQNVISKLYLIQNGSATQVHYANILKRKIFGQISTKLYYNSLFVDPDENIMLPIFQIFPKNYPLLPQQLKVGHQWIKYYANGQNYFIIPKKSKYIDMEILIEVFQGKTIQCP